jgi:hypothetical protein
MVSVYTLSTLCQPSLHSKPFACVGGLGSCRLVMLW